jgi:hypothetical protein
MSYVAGRASSGTTISINSGELDLKTRLNVSFALSAGAATAEVAREAALLEVAKVNEAAAVGFIIQLSQPTIISASKR